MENFELKSMTDFVLMQSAKMYSKIHERVGEPKYTVLQFITEVPNYAEFLKQENAVWMFIPCDEAGNVLKEPEDYEYFISDNEQYFNGDEEKCEKYEKAKERCLFLVDDYEIEDDVVIFQKETFMISKGTGIIIKKHETGIYKTIEQLANDPNINLLLSPAGIKKIGL